jgi:sirohydrochlorin ferrochelatase
MSRTAYIVFAHGSSIESANEAVRTVARDLAAAGGFPCVVAAFLEGGKPDLSAAAGEAAARGFSRAVVIPYFLTLGLHLQRDLPRLIDAVRRAHPGLELEVTQPLDGHPAMIQALLTRAREGSTAFSPANDHARATD